MVTQGDGRVSQFRKGALELAIMALLGSGELYGVEIVDRLAERPGLQASAGTVYPLLSRLKKSGALDSVWRESPVGPPRKYYAITPSGAEVLGAWREVWSKTRDFVDVTLEGGRKS